MASRNREAEIVWWLFWFIAFGIIDYFIGWRLAGLWIAFIGCFLLQGARDSYVEVTLQRVLSRAKVLDVMTYDVPTIDARMSIEHFVERERLRTGRRCYIVAIEEKPVSMVAPLDIRSVARVDSQTTPLEAVMRPLNKLRTLSPDESLMQAIEDMFARMSITSRYSQPTHGGDVVPRERSSFLQTHMELQNIAGSAHVHIPTLTRG